jgi:hypothetical protein
MQYFKRTLALYSILAVAVTGCNNQPTGEPTVAAELTEAQQKAINDIVAEVEAIGQSFAATLEGIGDLESLSLDSQTTCPALSLVVDPDIGATLVVDFPDGCTNDLYGESPVSGTVTMTLSLAAATLNVTFTDLAIDDQTSNGSFFATFSNEEGAITLVGDIDLTTTGVGRVTGSMNIVIDIATGTISIPLATLSVDPEAGDALSVAIVDMAIAPVSNGNFIPGVGTVAFIVPNDGAGPETITLVMNFDSQSPVDRTVDVAIGTADPVEYTIP